MVFRRFLSMPCVLLLCVFISRGVGQEQVADSTQAAGYQRAPDAIRQVLDTAPTPLVSVDPTRQRMVLVQEVRYPPIADLAQPMLRIAGLRIDPTTNGPHAPAYCGALTIQTIADQQQTSVTLPKNANGKLGYPLWSPDGQRFAFTNTIQDGIELWVADSRSGEARVIPNLRLNQAYGDAVDWMPDSRALLCQSIPADRGSPPIAPRAPLGPNIQESSGRAGPVRTYQDLLDSPYEEQLFDYYATSQLVLVSIDDGPIKPVGKPAIFSLANTSPDGRHLLVSRIHRPYSYLHPASDFPKEVEVWDLAGELEFKLASLPLSDRVPIEGAPTGPRGYHWLPTEAATLVWVEALDDGDPRNEVPHRDRVRTLRFPFDAEPVELARTEHRFAGITWGERDALGLLRDYDRDRRWSQTLLIAADKPGEPGRLIWSRSVRDYYGDAGTPLLRTLPSGHRVLWQDGDHLFLAGEGATPQGDRPFLDRFNLKTLQSERLFHCDPQSYESAVALLADDGSQFITRRETSVDCPNYFVRTQGQEDRRQLTNFADPAPQLRDIQKKLITYERADGVPLSFTLHLPPNRKPDERLPTIVWAYPREYNDSSTAGQVTGSPNRFTRISGISHLFLLLAGYAVLDNATMPVVGDPKTMNDTYVAQIVASAQAAIDKSVELGVTDPERVGIGGHSYGAFMTANLLAHSELFRAGVARSGAYNRTLTPFGFQSERRTFWEAPETYLKVSPFAVANQINEPLLLIHGEADNNPGTFPMQSERLYQAVRGHGGTTRLVLLPHESHGYVARESVEQTLYEMVSWFDKHVKSASPRQSAPATTSDSTKRQDVQRTGLTSTKESGHLLELPELERIANEELRRSNTPGAAIAIVRGQEVVFAKGFGLANVETGASVTPDMLFRLGSTTKMFTAATLLTLMEMEKIELDKPIGQHLNDLHPRIAGLTAHQLLTHTTGLTDESVMSGLQDDSALAQGVRRMDDGWFFTEPGAIYSYSNPGYWIAGMLCEELVHQPYADILSERLFKPLGMTRTSLRPTMAMTWPMALGHEVQRGKPVLVRPQADNAATRPAGQIYSSVLDLSRFAMAFLNDGMLDGRQVLSHDVIKKLSTPYVKVPGSDDQYAYGLSVTDFCGVRILQHGGSRSGYGSTIRFAPEHDVAVIVLTNRSGSSLPQSAAKALELMLPASTVPKREAVQVTDVAPEEMKSFVGTYTNHRQTAELYVESGKLFLKLRRGTTSEAAKEIVRLDQDVLAYGSRGNDDQSTPPNRIVVVRGENGVPEYICISGRALRRQ